MKPDVHAEALKRLSYIEGHLAGVRKMVQEDRYCVDVLKQTHAIRRAIEKLEGLMLEGHLETCVVEGIRDGRADQIVEQLRELYAVGGR